EYGCHVLWQSCARLDSILCDAILAPWRRRCRSMSPASRCRYRSFAPVVSLPSCETNRPELGAQRLREVVQGSRALAFQLPVQVARDWVPQVSLRLAEAQLALFQLEKASRDRLPRLRGKVLLLRHRALPRRCLFQRCRLL